MKINKKTLSLVILFCLILVIGIQLIAVAIEVPLSPYYSNSNTDWWQYQFEGYENDPDHAFNKNVNCGPACSAMLINYLKEKGVTTTYHTSISSAYPEVHCYARWDYCKANGHSNGYDNSDWSTPGGTTEQIISALSSENIQTHTFTGYDCYNDGRGITNLQNAIDQGKVCICLVAPMYYRDDVSEPFNHWVIAYGYDNNYIYLNDPGYISGEGFPASKSDFADALWHVTGLSTVIVSDTTIYNYPIVDSFSVTPTSITLGGSFNISYTVSDDIGLQQTELWRVNDVSGEPGDWDTLDNPIFAKVLSGEKNYSGSFTDTLDTAGTYWYGMHVVDTSGNWSVEPKPPGPIVVTVTNPTSTIYVPDDYSTIQAAVDVASSGDTIIVRDGTYDESITFPSDKVIILQSVNGRSSTIIRGDDGLDTITFDNSLTGTTIKGFIITHANGQIGRGIYIIDGDLTINDCIIFNNSADYGGGIRNYGDLTITASTIRNNSAADHCGGGIENCGSLTITQSTISNNSADYGGGIRNYGDLTITKSTIFNNSAYSQGGGIYNDYDCLLTITKSIISFNSADYGGGIYNKHNGDLTITESTICNNSAADHCGGGICNDYDGLLAITGSTISANTANYGGGIYIYSFSVTIIVGGESLAEKNTICSNYKSGYNPSLDQQIRDASGSLYETYKDNNYISAYCIGDNPPTIEIISPSDGEIVSGTVRFSSYSTDDYGMDKVEWYIDDELKMTYGPFGPYTSGSTCNWDCDTTPDSIGYIPDGNHTFKVKVCDTAGQTAVDNISFIVDNIVENQPPVADAGVNQTVHSGQVVWFDGCHSSDPDGTIVSYKWDFGDGGIATGCHANHRFRGATNESKTYTVSLTVEDGNGATATDSCDITVMPLEKTVEITYQPPVPVPGESVFARMTVLYNWIHDDDYVISRIYYQSGGFIGVGVISIWDLHSHVVPTPRWTATILFSKEKTYSPVLEEIHYGGDIFQGIEVDAFDAMSVHISGWAGISISIGPSVPAPFFEMNSACFQPDYTEAPEVPVEAPNFDLAHLYSPGEMRIYDSEGRVTGLVNGEVKEEIPYSAYNDNTIIILSPVDSYRYEVVGTYEGSYGLGVASVEDGEVATFTATDIPTTSRAVHQYTIDWETLSQGGEGVTVQVDSDGDGKFEDTFTSDDELTQDEFLEETSPPLIGDFGSANSGPPDCKVDFEDLMIFALAYRATLSDPNWNAVCDIAGPGGPTPDGIIDFEDLMVFAMHYGETCIDL